MASRQPAITLPSQKAYALWAGSYPPYAHNELMRIEQAGMLQLMPTLAGCNVLDLACGSGRYGLIAQQQSAKLVFGTDNSVPMLLSGVAGGVVFPLIQSTMHGLPFANDTFDVVICGLATGHLSLNLLTEAFREVSRVLNSDGILLFSDFHPVLYANGGRRTFAASDGERYAVEHYPHSIHDYQHIITATGLVVEVIKEPSAVVENQSIPAVLIMRCCKCGK